MGLFLAQLRALLIKEMRLARNNVKATVAEVLFPILMGTLTGVFILLVTVIQNEVGGEYSDLHDVPNPGYDTDYGRWLGYTPATLPDAFVNATQVAQAQSNGTFTAQAATAATIQDAFMEALIARHSSNGVYAGVVGNANSPPTIFGANFVDVKHGLKLLLWVGAKLADLHFADAVPLSTDITSQMLYISINLRAIFSSTGCALLIYAFIPAVMVTAGRLVDDKKVKARETLKVMGCSDLAYLLANALSGVVRMGVGCCLIAFILAAFQAIPPADIVVVGGIALLFALTLIAYAQITPSVTSTPIWANVMCIMLLALGAVVSGLSTGWPVGLQYLMCLISPVAFFYGVLPSLANGSVTLHLTPWDAAMMLIIDLVIYVAVGNYIYAINPGDFGVPKHPLFFIRWIWAKKEDHASDKTPLVNASENTDAGDVPSDARVVLRNLMKFFGTQRDTPSVDNLSLSIKRGEIYALLGHNGAGKTTTMSILTGMITPTSYTQATVDGYDIAEDMDRIRQSVGLCPQFDVLFGDLSARDHFLLFARIKGVQDVEAVVDKLLDDLELPTDNQRADTFSGGMKRRLSVGNSIVGGATLLFLDEPSSGMDPLSRRQMWNLLKRQREEGKTIVLTTHFMEEADYLGDRIAIMSKGRMFCCETSSALKQRFGTGFKLTVAKNDQFNQTELESLLSDSIGRTKKVGDGHGDASYEIPSDQLPNFPELLRQLERRSAELGVADYGIQMNTLEDVFVNISSQEEERIARERAEKRGESYGADEIEEQRAHDVEDLLQDIAGKSMNDWMAIGAAVSDNARLLCQAKQVFMQKWSLFKRSRRIQTMVFGFPVFFLFFAFVSLQPQQVQSSDDTFVHRKDVETNNFHYVVVTPRDAAANTELLDELNHVYNETYQSFPTMIRTDDYGDVTSGQYLPVKTVSFVDGFKSPSVPGGLVMHHNSLNSASGDAKHLQASILWSPTYDATFAASFASVLRTAAQRVACRHHDGPCDQKASYVMNISTFDIPKSGNTSFHVDNTPKKNVMQLGIYMVLSIGQIVANLAIPMADEMTRNVYHTCMAQGLMPQAYFIGNFAFDLIVCIYPFLLFVIGIFWQDIVSYYSGALVLCILAGLLYCAHAILQAYIFVTYLQGMKPYVYTVMIHGLNLATMGFPYLIDKLLQAAKFEYQMDIKPYLLSLFPSCSWYHIIDNTSDFDRDATSASAIFVFTGIRTGWGFVFLLVELVVPMVFIFWFMNNNGFYRRFQQRRERTLAAAAAKHDEANAHHRASEDASASHSPRAAEDTVQHSGEMRSNPAITAGDDEDEDVQAERRRIEDGAAGDGSDMVRMTHLRKQYGDAKVALKDLSLGVGKGECFGLLGPNGAGKSTACKLILNQLSPSAGEILFPYAGVSSSSPTPEIFRGARLGVCQQTDTLWETMSAEEHMEQFLRLRLTTAYHHADWEPYIKKTLERVKLDDAGGKVAGGYSGGMKRKLQVCLAMYTGAKSVFLDEPSTGMDPFARRALWKVILDACSGEACVVLTTHSMDEAEAVCGRIGIITSGRLRCLGTTQHLKGRFGKGYVITIAFEATATDESRAGIRDVCRKEFGTSFHVKEELGSLHRYGVDEVASLADAFSFLEKHASKHGVEQYSVTQTASLEEIFLGFVTTTRDN